MRLQKWYLVQPCFHHLTDVCCCFFVKLLLPRYFSFILIAVTYWAFSEYYQAYIHGRIQECIISMPWNTELFHCAAAWKRMKRWNVKWHTKFYTHTDTEKCQLNTTHSRPRKRWRWAVSFASSQFYSWGPSPQYPMVRRFGWTPKPVWALQRKQVPPLLVIEP